MFKMIGAICGFGFAGLVLVALGVAINVAWILGVVWVVKTVLF